MEKVTPLDLERAQIPTAVRGYRKEAVDRLLATASHQLEAQVIEIRRLQALLKVAEEDLVRYKELETSLNSALIIALQAAEETRALAQKEADLILADAKCQAKEIKSEAQSQVRSLEWEAEKLQGEQDEFRRRFQALLHDFAAKLAQSAPTHAVLQVEEPEAATG